MEFQCSLPCPHNSSLLPSIVSHIDQFHAIPLYLYKIYFNIILPSTFTCSKWTLYTVYYPSRAKSPANRRKVFFYIVFSVTPFAKRKKISIKGVSENMRPNSGITATLTLRLLMSYIYIWSS